MPRCAVVMKSQLDRFGRWDADFHILWKENERMIEWLRLMYTDDDLETLAMALPVDKHLIKQVTGQWNTNVPVGDLRSRTKDSPHPTQLLLYVAASLNSGSGDDALQEIRKHVEIIDARRHVIAAALTACSNINPLPVR